MKSSRHADLAVIGAGIVGLAHALAAARRGLRVVVFERTPVSVGASVRNFGLVWPIGQPAGARHDRALRTREIWSEVAGSAGLHLDPAGSLHLAYRPDEWAVLREFAATPLGSDHGRTLLTPRETVARSAAAVPNGLLGALWSPTEATVDPMQAIRRLPAWLAATHGVELQFGTTVRAIALPNLETTAGSWRADRVIVCSGQDFETLYPEVFAVRAITRCKLQMLRTVRQPEGWRLGPALCAGLTLAHYDAFRDLSTLPALVARLRAEFPFHTEHGIHILVSQTSAGQVTIGDSHHYGLTVDPFDREDINAAILSGLRSFAHLPEFRIGERWHGVYPKLTDGSSEWVVEAEPGVWIVNGLGGAGMSLSFGLAEEVMARL